MSPKRLLISVFLILNLIILPSIAKNNSKKSEAITKLRKLYPNAKLIQVSPEKLEELKNDPLLKDKIEIKTFRLAQPIYIDPAKEVKRKDDLEEEKKKKKNEDEKQESKTKDSKAPESRRVDYNFDYFFYTIFSSSKNSSTGSSDINPAVYIFAIIGAVVVVAWIAYAGWIIYDAIRGIGFNPWFQLDGEFLGILTSINSDRERSGILSGVKFTLGMDKNNSFDIGLVSQLGFHSITEQNNTTNTRIECNGAYALIGPAIFLGGGGKDTKWAYLYLELTGGTSTSGNVGLISMTKVGVDFSILSPLKNEIMLGFYFGSMYFNLKHAGSMIRTIDKFSLITGGTLGYQF